MTSATQSKQKIDSLEQSTNDSTIRIEKLNSDILSIYENAKDSYDNLIKKAEDISNMRTELEFLIIKGKELNLEIEKLLPGATSTSLATAFEQRKKSFRIPIIGWGIVFIFSILSLLAVAYIDPFSFQKVTLSHDILLPYFIGRLPFAIPIIWLAIYAGRRHSQALRLEEDYAHKEALSKSFEGYKKQLIEIESELENKTATLNLIDRTLHALSLHPGRIYQGKHEDISPFQSFQNLIPKNKIVNDDSIT